MVKGIGTYPRFLGIFRPILQLAFEGFGLQAIGIGFNGNNVGPQRL